MSAAELVQRFANLPLRFPEREMEFVQRYSQTKRAEEGAQQSGDHRPFERYVDLWWASVCIGVRQGRRTTEADAGPWHKFIDTNQILPSDPWRAEHLMLLAVAVTGSTEILAQPSSIIQMANEYAATGIRVLAESMAREGRPIWGATKLLEELSSSVEVRQSV